jgi:hypothetical protein
MFNESYVKKTFQKLPEPEFCKKMVVKEVLDEEKLILTQKSGPRILVRWGICRPSLKTPKFFTFEA